MEPTHGFQIASFFSDVVRANPIRSKPVAFVVTHLLQDRPFFVDALAEVCTPFIFAKPKSLDLRVYHTLRHRYRVEIADRGTFADASKLKSFIDENVSHDDR